MQTMATIGCGILAWIIYRILFLDYYRAQQHLDSKPINFFNPFDLIPWLIRKVLWLASRLFMILFYAMILAFPFFIVLICIPMLIQTNRQNISMQDVITQGQAELAKKALAYESLPFDLPANVLEDFQAKFPSPSSQEQVLQWAKSQLPHLPIQQAPTEVVFKALVMQLWYLDPAAFEARKKKLQDAFGGEKRFSRDIWNALMNYGTDVAKENGWDTLLQLHPERAAMVAATDRLCGRDAYAEKISNFCRYEVFIKGQPTDVAKSWSLLAMMASAYYPNDDLPYLALGEGFTYSAAGGEMSLPARIALVLAIILLALIVQRAMRLTTICLLGRLFRIRETAEYRIYEKQTFNPYWQLGTIFVVVFFSYPLSRLTSEPFNILHCRSEGTFLAATVWGVMMGSILVEAIESFITLWFIRKGMNPHLMVRDNVYTAVISGLLLSFFQNSIQSVLLAIAVGLASSIYHKWKVHQSAHLPVFDLASDD